MKNRRISQISASQESGEDSENEAKSISKVSSTLNNNRDSSESSDTSSEAERDLERERSFVEQEKSTKINKTSVSGSPLKRFTLENPDLVKQESKVVISEDDEVCFLEVPKSLNIEEFLGKSINFDKKTKLKINKVRYVIEPSTESIKPITLLTKGLQVIHPVARLELREYTKHKNDTIEIESVKFKPSLPENLKVRHPLFGSEYKNKITLSEEIERKLDNTIDDFVKKMKKKKKMHKEKTEKEEERTINENNETIFALLESHSPSKKKKKKHKTEADMEDIDEDHAKKINIINHIIIPPTSSESESPGKKKKKKKKHETEAKTDVEETEGEETDYGRNKKMSIINSTVIPGLQLPSFEFDVSGIMKKDAQGTEKEEKRKSRTSLSFMDEDLQTEEETRFNDESSGKKKKKKKNKEKSFEESEYETEKESSHRKRRTSQVNERPETDESGNAKKTKREENEETDESSPKKKRKKEKTSETETNSLIMDILSRVRGEMDDSSKPKKKDRSHR